MSPVSRGRKGKQNTRTATQRSSRANVFAEPTDCDCPSCTGEQMSTDDLINALVGAVEGVADADDPLEAEILGAALLAIGRLDGDQFDAALVDELIPNLEARATASALAALLGIGSVATGKAHGAASAAAGRLVRAGIAEPRWAAELGQPVLVTDCRRLSDSEGTASMLTCLCQRAGRSHAVIISVDDMDCGAADNILIFDGDQLPGALDTIRAEGRSGGFDITTENLDPAEFRWRAESALDARAVHDGDAGDDNDDLADDDGPGYHALAAVARARVNQLPASGKPKAPHGDGGSGALGLDEILAQLVGNRRGIGSGRRGSVAAAMPPKRKKSAGPAPIYQLKVALQGAKPPIWRRLEVPGDISLGDLHQVIQGAFDWDDGHMHVFETPYGSFGTPDRELEHRAEGKVTLEQVAPDPKSKIVYTYDFGDDWDHAITVEKVLVRDAAVQYPRCTGGRRAAPPEDCGGIWGYADLVDILRDPTHPEHLERLEWLGLEDASEFDADAFDPTTVNERLSGA